MKLVVLGAILVGGFGLGACHPAAWAEADREGAAHSGRYLGIGIYSPGKPWTKMVGADDPKATVAAAKMIDDQVVIVVQDSQTGEVRACGDLTGYCVSMNPWKKQLALTQVAPINLTEHVTPPQDGAEVTVTTPHRRARPKTPADPKAPPAPQSPAGTPATS